jgi:hypothetical protein
MCGDRSAATAPARAGLRARFEREVDPDGTMQPDERARRVDGLARAHMAKMTLRASQARRLKATGRVRSAGATLAAELRAAAVELEAV